MKGGIILAGEWHTLIPIDTGNFHVVTLGRGYVWLDTGTMDSLFAASEFVRAIEMRSGIHISMPEEIAFQNGWIDRESLAVSARAYGKSPYGQYLQKVVDGKVLFD